MNPKSALYFAVLGAIGVVLAGGSASLGAVVASFFLGSMITGIISGLLGAADEKLIGFSIGGGLIGISVSLSQIIKTVLTALI